MQDLSNVQLFARYREAQAAVDLIRDEIRSRDIAWQHLATYGMKFEAVMKYRLCHKSDLRAAHDAVTGFISQLDE